MPDIEELAVGAVKNALAYCPRLKSEILANDKTPITDGHIDLYEGVSRKVSELLGRVPVQVKGRTHTGKKTYGRSFLTFSVDLPVLAFFRDNQGGVYFYVAVDPDARQQKVFYANMIPFKLDRLLKGVKPGQKSASIRLRELPTEAEDVERIFDLAWQARKQNVQQGASPMAIRDGVSLTIYSADGVDLSKPTTLSLDETDFAVVMHTTDGLNLHVDIDLQITPQSYVSQLRDIVTSCGGVTYPQVSVRQLDENTLEMLLGPLLRLVVDETTRTMNLTVALSSSGSLVDQLHAMDFFMAAHHGSPIRIDDGEYTPSSIPGPPGDDLVQRRQLVLRMSEVADALGIDPSTIDASKIDDQQAFTISRLHEAIVNGMEIHADDGAAGRFDLPFGPANCVLMVLPGESEHMWRFINVFDIANRRDFKLYGTSENGELVEVEGTAYEGLEEDELAVTANLRLSTIVEAYAALDSREHALRLVTPKVLHLLLAADNPLAIQSEQLLRAAEELNDWLIAESPEPESVHLINRWQMRVRRGLLDEEDRAAIRAERRRALRSSESNADEIDVCCAILLGDPEDIAHSLDALDPDKRADVESWPIWHLYRPSESKADPATVSPDV